MDFDQISLFHANTSIYTSYSQNKQNNDLITEAIQLAINIFDEYIKKGAENIYHSAKTLYKQYITNLVFLLLMKKQILEIHIIIQLIQKLTV